MNATRPTTRVLIILSITAAFALSMACAAPENANAPTTPATNNTTTTTTTTTTTAPTNTATTTTAPTNTNTATTTVAAGSVGVQECDDFLAKYETCLNSKAIPEAARAQYKTSFEQTRDAWRKAAATPQGKASLAQACKTMRDTTKQAMSSFGCTF